MPYDNTQNYMQSVELWCLWYCLCRWQSREAWPWWIRHTQNDGPAELYSFKIVSVAKRAQKKELNLSLFFSFFSSVLRASPWSTNSCSLVCLRCCLCSWLDHSLMVVVVSVRVSAWFCVCGETRSSCRGSFVGDTQLGVLLFWILVSPAMVVELVCSKCTLMCQRIVYTLIIYCALHIVRSALFLYIQWCILLLARHVCVGVVLFFCWLLLFGWHDICESV